VAFTTDIAESNFRYRQGLIQKHYGRMVNAMKRNRTQAERSTATRRALVEAAVSRLIAHGYAGATVRNIARESGVSPGAVQYHFKSKEDIAIAALTHLFEEVAQRLAAINPRDTAIDECARRIVDTLWEFYGGTRYFAAAEILMATRQQAALHRRIRSCRLGLAAAYRDMWDRLMGDTLLDPTERRHLLQFVIATLRGLALLRLHERDPELFDPHLARLRDLVAAAMREGAAPRIVDPRARQTPGDLARAPALFV
jgi:AcrR family transcriptional regulator